MTYNFDPERWYEKEYSALETLREKGNNTEIEFEEQYSKLLNRYEEILSRLDGTYQLPKWKPGEKRGVRAESVPMSTAAAIKNKIAQF